MAHEHEFYYYPSAPNEDGWRCCGCDHKPGEPPGFSPELDRTRTFEKVNGLCMDLHDRDLVYFSNSDHGLGVADSVAGRCKAAGIYDQYSIVQWVFEAEASHAEYWRKISEDILAGKDGRSRCPCGLLSNSTRFAGGGRDPTHRCSKHTHDEAPEPAQLTFDDGDRDGEK